MLSHLRPGESRAYHVQTALGAIANWPSHSHPIWTVDVPEAQFIPITIPIEPHHTIVWGIHRGHRHKKGISPFIQFPDKEKPRTSRITISLKLTADVKVVITHIYPGEQMLPPVWIANPSLSAESLLFWQSHGYVATRRNILPRTVQEQPPNWWYAGR